MLHQKFLAVAFASVNIGQPPFAQGGQGRLQLHRTAHRAGKSAVAAHLLQNHLRVRGRPNHHGNHRFHLQTIKRRLHTLLAGLQALSQAFGLLAQLQLAVNHIRIVIKILNIIVICQTGLFQPIISRICSHQSSTSSLIAQQLHLPSC